MPWDIWLGAFGIFLLRLGFLLGTKSKNSVSDAMAQTGSSTPTYSLGSRRLRGRLRLYTSRQLTSNENLGLSFNTINRSFTLREQNLTSTFQQVGYRKRFWRRPAGFLV